MTRLTLSFLIVLLCSTTALAEATFQFNMPGLQAPKDPDVLGMRFVFLYGKNQSVRGLDLGFASISESVTQSGFTFNMGLSKVTGASSGCACSLVNVHTGNDSGFNGAFINIVHAIEKGVNGGFVNVTDGFSNVDIGGLSISKKSTVQIGFINFTDEITGVQIGFLNVAENGFFPVFPLFNFPKQEAKAAQPTTTPTTN
jgi:hypothetical protein